jgi:hypothetical protein
MQDTAARLLAWIAAGVFLSATIPAATTAGTGNQRECEVHEPIRILEDKGDDGFVWDDPVTGEEVYRPGSGVVAGDGTASNPYVIEGWWISGADGDPPAIELKQCGFDFGDATPDPESTGVVCGTTAHFVIQNTTVNLWEHDTGIGNVSADSAAIEQNDYLNNTHQVFVDEAPGIEIRDNLVHGVDTTEMVRVAERGVAGATDDAVVRDERVVGAGTLVDVEGDGVRVANNSLDGAGTFGIEAYGQASRSRTTRSRPRSSTSPSATRSGWAATTFSSRGTRSTGSGRPASFCAAGPGSRLGTTASRPTRTAPASRSPPRPPACTTSPSRAAQRLALSARFKREELT